MKLESLKVSKFDKFKGSELQDSFRIVGGAPQSTTYNGSDGQSGSDVVDFDTGNAAQGTGTLPNGTVVDYWRTSESSNSN